MLNKRYFLLLLILSVAFLIYSPSLKNDFIWDDFHLVVNDADIKEVGNLPNLFRIHLFNSTCGSNFYRPMQTVLFMFDYQIWKLNPFGYHLTNLLLHLLNVILVYFLVSRIFKDPGAGLLTCLIFAVHPVNTEAVTYIAGRADPLGCVFFLSALLLYMGFRGNKSTPVLFFLSIACFAFSLLTKEAMLIFPLVLILYDAFILKHDSVDRRFLGLYGPYFLVVVLYVAFRFFVMGLPFELSARIPFNIFLFTMAKVFILYLGLLFFPFTLHMERIEPTIASIFDPQAIFSMAVITCLIWMSVLIYKRSKTLFFFVAFFFVTLLPMLNILTINAMMAEHWLYLPSIGAYSVVSFGIARLLDLKRPILKQPPLARFVVFILLGFLSFFLIRTTLRNIEWGHPLEFYKNMLKHSPRSVRGRSNLAMVYMASKDYKAARQEFQTALQTDPKNSFCYYGLGLLDYLEDNPRGAFGFWKKALDIAPLYKTVSKNMNLLLYKENKRFRRLLRAVSIKPKSIMANFRLSTVYLNNGLYIEALDRLERILEDDPEYANALFNRAWIYSKLGIYKKAIEEYEKVMALTPNDPDIYMNSGFCYAALNKRKEAQAMLEKAMSLR